MQERSYGYSIEATPEQKKLVSHLALIKGRFVYLLWLAFKQAKFKSLWFNMLYMRYKRFIKGDTLRPGEYF